jgi:protein-tyrosine phosphatase
MTAPPMPVTVLFVCMGNICRSPTGEGVFRRYVDVQGKVESIQVDSAGTAVYAKRRRRGYRLESVARLVTSEDLGHFDLVVAMDRDNYDDLVLLHEGDLANIKMLGEFIPGIDTITNPPSVPDPYYGGVDGFEQVIDMIERARPAMLDHCLSLLANS